jgi:hypothetical protein
VGRAGRSSCDPSAGILALDFFTADLATNGSVPAVEHARTVLENAYSTGVGSPRTLSEDATEQNTAAYSSSPTR